MGRNSATLLINKKVKGILTQETRGLLREERIAAKELAELAKEADERALVGEEQKRGRGEGKDSGKRNSRESSCGSRSPPET